MEFSPANHVVKLCLQGMAMEENGQHEDAARAYLQAWNDATDDFEKFTAGYYIARQQQDTAERLRWYETVLQLALAIDDDTVYSALPALYKNIARCYELMGEDGLARKHEELSATYKDQPTDKGPFYHGTRANLQPGDMLTAGRLSNYHDGVIMNHIYFTAMPNGAGFAAALAKGEGRERVYIVEPTGSYENDPNVTDLKFPGNPTRSYRTAAPMKIVGEVREWNRLSPEQIQSFRDKLAQNNGEIIN
jgi:hypothetical protein